MNPNSQSQQKNQPERSKEQGKSFNPQGQQNKQNPNAQQPKGQFRDEDEGESRSSQGAKKSGDGKH